MTSLSGLSVACTPVTSTAWIWLTWVRMASSWPAKLSSSVSVNASRASLARWATSSREIWDTTAKPNGWPDGRRRLPKRRGYIVVPQCWPCVRIYCVSSWPTGRAALGRWRSRSARWAPTSSRSTWSSAATAMRSTTWWSNCPGSDARHADHCCRGAERRPGRQRPPAHRPVGSPPRAGTARSCGRG